MSVAMYHHAEILDAISGICSGTIRLSEDTSGDTIVHVGSNRLFSVGDSVELVDDASVPEAHTVAGLEGLTQVILDGPIGGTYSTASNARIRLTSADLPALAWVGRGTPKIGPQPPGVNFPCAIVAPTRIAQPLTGGTNRTFDQDYWTSVYYVRPPTAGEDEEGELLAEVGRLFNLLMTDPYLGGACWYSQVTKVDYDVAPEAELRDQGFPVRVVRLDVVARRCELGPSV